MTREQIRQAIRSGLPFFGMAPKGKVMARYVPYGPVFVWDHHQIIPTPLQGDDLLWWLHASDEESH